MNMGEEKKIRISVRNLVEFILREGDIDNRRGGFGEKEAMQEGSRIHRKIQIGMGSGYQAEVPLSFDVRWEMGAAPSFQKQMMQSGERPELDSGKNILTLTIEGRADGIFTEKNPYAEAEIKELEGNQEHSGSKKNSKQKNSKSKNSKQKNLKRNIRMDRRVAYDPCEPPDFSKESIIGAESVHTYLKTKTVSEYDDNKTDEGFFGLPEVVYIDEIKGIYRDVMSLEYPVPVHLAQAKCYAYMVGIKRNLSHIGVQMTYCNLETEELRRFRQIYEKDKLEAWFLDLVGQYRKWAQFEVQWRQVRQASIRGLEFPFPWRSGQKEVASSVYRTILRKKKLFIQAPTGTGKTLSTVFPAVKAVGEGLADRIFYATAKTITRTVAEEAFGILRESGLRMKTVTLTAKEKICFLEETECNPDACPYAKGHYDRVNDAVFELISEHDVLNRQTLEAQAEKWRVCPFEMGLDAALWTDSVICDYNYIFDPRARLKRFFGEGVKGEYLFLIDEAHNLVERGREMYSASLYKEEFLALKNEFQALGNINNHNTRPHRYKSKQKEALSEDMTSFLNSSSGENWTDSLQLSEQSEKKDDSTENTENTAASAEPPRILSRKHRPADLMRNARAIVWALNRCNTWLLSQKREMDAPSDTRALSDNRLPSDTASFSSGENRSLPASGFGSASTGVASAGYGRKNVRILNSENGGIGTFPQTLMNLCGLIETFLEDSLNRELNEKTLDFYFQLRRFLDTCDHLSDNYVIYTEQLADGRFLLRLYCVDISENLQECLDKGRSTVYFSATFLPINYYKSLLSTQKDDYAIYAHPTFDPANRLILIGADTSSRYKNRSPQEYRKMAEYVFETVQARRGNYMVFFSSYQMMDEVADRFDQICIEKEDSIETVRQMSRMSEEEREAFLEKFEQPHPKGLAGFCVMGGIFGEGIDLRGERLIGAIIVGAGLPQVCTERELLKEFYEKRGEDGFFYAYLCPGMNRVLQSAGRVIRTESDRGIILLLDERFAAARYRSMFPVEWEQPGRCTLKTVREKEEAFWEQ
ncbi:MAG: ATP-dependent DNA helicase [Lachnospiraceae bacterium]|nr:ATP-dependent DNA helicase [Lachnospiraceae bacterium]